MSKVSGIKATANSDAGKTWQQSKSENTRTVILDATIQCFYDIGYNNTTTEKVAAQAGVSRGAMLHHFPSRLELIKATVLHLHQKRLVLFEEQERRIQDDAEHSLIEEGIDAYWKQLHSPLFVVFHELRVAARTDMELKKILIPTIRKFEQRWQAVTESVFPDFALSDDFEMANLLTVYLLEGMAVNGVIRGAIPQKMIPWLKDRLREMLSDVDDLDRKTARKSKRK